MYKGVKRHMIKIIAALLMLVDHVGMVFFKDFIILRYIGRLAMPLFAYCTALGFYRTTSLKKYIIRMGLFSLFSQIPFWMLMYASDNKDFQLMHFNIGFTFLGALFVLYLYKDIKTKTCKNKILNSIGILSILILSTLLRCDYGAYAILLVMVFYEFYVLQKNVLLTLEMFLTATFMLFVMGKGSQFQVQLFGLPALFIIIWIEDKRVKGFKYFFYIFYPVHMLILSIIKWIL